MRVCHQNSRLPTSVHGSHMGFHRVINFHQIQNLIKLSHFVLIAMNQSDLGRRTSELFADFVQHTNCSLPDH
uniref:Uncharacterized protein n=1 Tax=Anguilla anguilla TaxID=7936 RepID=A0A0E9RHP5_ANGAN